MRPMKSIKLFILLVLLLSGLTAFAQNPFAPSDQNDTVPKGQGNVMAESTQLAIIHQLLAQGGYISAADMIDAVLISIFAKSSY